MLGAVATTTGAILDRDVLSALSTAARQIALLLVMWWFWRGQDVHVGADGIAVAKPGWRVFVPAGDVREVRRVRVTGSWFTRECWELTIARRSTEAAAHVHLSGVPPAQVDAIEARLRHFAARSAERRERMLTALHRGTRDVATWQRDLAGLLAGGGFRTAALSAEDLRQVLDDPTASGEQRLGAALALRGGGEDLERVRIAAEASARPKLRAALERVGAHAGDHDLAIAEALAESEAEAKAADAEAKRRHA